MSTCHTGPPSSPAKLMSSEYPAYTWPYGARALMAEREKVQKLLELSGQMTGGWACGPQAVVFQVPLSFHEGFVRNDTERMGFEHWCWVSACSWTARTQPAV